MGEKDFRWELLESLKELLAVAEHPETIDEDTRVARIARARDAVSRGEHERRLEMDRFF